MQDVSVFYQQNKEQTTCDLSSINLEFLWCLKKLRNQQQSSILKTFPVAETDV